MNFKEYHGYKVWDNGMVYGKYGHLLKPGFNGDGYLHVGLHINGKRHTKVIHSLMGILFLPNFKGKPTIDHKDCKRNNNSLYNLKWATYREQQLNRKLKCTNISGVNGVHYRKDQDKWVASISPSANKRINKSFKTKIEAIAQRLAWEEEYYNLN